MGKLIGLYDDNGISIDGEVEGWFSDDTPGRFKAYGWHVIDDVDGHDVDAVDAAISAAKQDPRPSLICCKTTIGKGSPNKQGSASSHGAALGEGEVAATRENLGWGHEAFVIPDTIYQAWDQRATGQEVEQQWQDTLSDYAQANADKANELQRRMRGELPQNLDAEIAAQIQTYQNEGSSIASRKASQNALNFIGPSSTRADWRLG